MLYSYELNLLTLATETIRSSCDNSANWSSLRYSAITSKVLLCFWLCAAFKNTQLISLKHNCGQIVSIYNAKLAQQNLLHIHFEMMGHIIFFQTTSVMIQIIYSFQTQVYGWTVLCQDTLTENPFGQIFHFDQIPVLLFWFEMWRTYDDWVIINRWLCLEVCLILIGL